jgi:hypothetical protein
MLASVLITNMVSKKKKVTNMVKKEMLHTSTNFGNTKKKNKYD